MSTRPMPAEGGEKVVADAKRLDLIRHALGWPKNYRNYFAAAPEGDDYPHWCALVAAGLAKRGHTINSSPNELVIFHVTDAGRALLAAVAA